METGIQPPAGTSDGQGWCHWHDGPSGTARLVDAHERQSGPPVALYACAPCREQRGLPVRLEAS
ncbi:hypothetical protein FEF34_10380 [Streptomyces marianii]|uniref:Uncharacterized protein n=1 Tax=Streptomyces marianii TaxID=1817406 RepID=A0A5R9E280_9ACTN|nr:hypothetical protein FEF34_10380 [Streptomyces marianii]